MHGARGDLLLDAANVHHAALVREGHILLHDAIVQGLRVHHKEGLERRRLLVRGHPVDELGQAEAGEGNSVSR